MKYWKKLAALGLGFTMVFGQTAYADIIIPPIPDFGISQPGSGAVTAPIPQSGSGTVTAPMPQPGGKEPTPGPQQGSPEAEAGTASELPKVEAEGAVLMDAATGKVLFGKNENTQFFPASITKVMTALLVLEHCRLDEVVTFSEAATTNLESGAVALDITEGDKLMVEQCLYGLLLKSANEIGNGLAEHVAGSVSAFADMMNARARELGCLNTNFKNPHGLNDAEHKTTPYDMALILRAALENETFRRIDTTRTYEFPATKKAAARTITMGHKMMYPSDSRYYEGIIGGKTGYTSLAGNTLVTGAERNGVRLIAVVMKSKSTHYQDTKAMLDYGFANYEKLTGSSAGTQGGTVGPTQGETGPSQSEIGPSQSETGPTQGETGPSQSETGPAQSENGSAQSEAASPQSQASGASQTGWKEEGAGWYYIKENGMRVSNEWLQLDGFYYWFDANGYMGTGWRSFADGSYYYLHPETGTMMTGWIQDVDWYYLGPDGQLWTNTTTPDGCQVNEYGIWVQ